MFPASVAVPVATKIVRAASAYISTTISNELDELESIELLVELELESIELLELSEVLSELLELVEQHQY